MKLFSRATLATALVAAAFAAPVSAQAWKWDFGINGGYSWYRAMLGSDETGLPDGTNGDDVKFEAGWLVGSQLGFWFTPRIGIRANATYAERPIVTENFDLLDDVEDDNIIEDINLWSGSGDVLFRLKTPKDEFTKFEMLPYIALGLGGKWHNGAEDEGQCVNDAEDEQWACHAFQIINDQGQGTGRYFALSELKGIMGLVGLGADWRLGRNFALRTEISDRIYRPKLMQVTPDQPAGRTWTVVSGDGDDEVSQVVHEIAGQLGLHLLFGVPRPVAVAVAPAPVETPVTPPPAPAPRDVPREETISVCVIDPTVPGGIRIETATFIPSTRDTMVTVNGQRVLLRNAVGNVMVASNADWYVQGRPLTMTIGGEKVEFVTYGTSRMVASTELGFLGTINGVPVYADKDEIADVQEELNELNRAQRGTDLAKLLEEHKDLREDLEDVKVLYVPLQPTGCVFQAVQRQEQVRKTR
jgi:hypothetical protein